MTSTHTPAISTPASAQTISNRAFAVEFGWALLALTLSALIVIGTYVSLSPLLDRFEQEATRDNIRPWSFVGTDLVPRMGKALPQDKALRITELASGVDERAIFSRRTRLQAADYPFLETTIADRHPGAHMYFIWRTARAPEEVFYLPIYWTNDKPQLKLLAKHEEWRGTITEIGIDVYGELRGQGPLVSALTLQPNSAPHLLRAIWAEWTAFRVWTQKSAHHLKGTPPRQTQSVTAAMAAWAGTAVLLLVLLGFARHRHSPVACAAAVLIPWLALDLLWQKNLNTQLDETRYLFAGKTQHEKHLADREHELYSYGLHLKVNVLPTPGVRIFLLNKGPIRDYRRLRMQYYLLPHNVFNFGWYPRPDKLQDGDYLLVLDEVKGLRFNADHSELRWPKNKSIPVELVDEGEFAQLYRYRGEGS
ncbi:hypothetical protein A3709_02770 [Halioglobus sp. HI00S01]|uniref:hypothetical protein n=2 Tax=Halioglobus sp. HI00S01 TaxID=1822214 RepID=UPI0007C2D0EC|nr:hypothetical protein [Halioglobus sp. HI00S01]KZX58402.1 hypothetical protein A3709_02770 [Halioglobus sp. HI00S01]